MFIYKAINDFCSCFFKKKWYILFPFSLFAIIFIVFYYVISSIYMLFDLAVRKIDDLLCGNYDNTSGGVLVVRNILAFTLIIPFYAVTVCLTIVLAILYFIIYIFAFIGCGFKKNGELFAFHNYFENNTKS